jgi:hypothetical protein
MKLWPLVAVVLALNASAQPQVKDVQAEINKLRKPVAGIDYHDRDPINLTKKWSTIIANREVGCFGGDLCSEERLGLVSVSRKDTLSPDFKVIRVFRDKIFLSKEDWSCLTDENLKVTHAFARAEFLSSYFLTAGNGKKYAVLDSLLNEALPPQYDSVVLASRAVMDDDNEPDFIVKKDSRWGVVDNHNKLKVAFDYDVLVLLDYFRGFAAKKDGKFAFLRRDSLPVTPFIYDTIYSDWSPSNFLLVKDRKIGLMDHHGKMQLKPSLDNVTRTSLYGCRCAKMNGKYAVLSSRGKNLSGFVYEDFKPYQLVHDEMLLKKNGKWGFFGCKSEKEISAFIYDRVVSFSGYEAEMMLNGAKKKIELKDERH